MDKFTLTSITQASRTLLLFVLTYLNCFQFSYTFHCIVISNTHIAVTSTRSNLTLSNLYLIPYCKTRNNNKNKCYFTNINVYGPVKLTTVLLVPTINFNQLGSETRTHSSRSIRTNASSNIGLSSPKKPNYKGGKSKMTPPIVASSDHAHNNTKDENEHLRKSDKRSKQKKGQTMRQTQETARRKPRIQLRGRIETDEVWRPQSSYADRNKQKNSK